MVSVANNPFMLSVVMLNIIILSVNILSVVASFQQLGKRKSIFLYPTKPSTNLG